MDNFSKGKQVPKKRFGQNFLVDLRKADRLVNALRIEPGDTILEIGPGEGVLTEKILAKGVDLIAVELDRDLLPLLKERFGGNDRFKLIENDIIKTNPTNWAADGLKVIGNLPYNISGALVEWLIEYHEAVKRAVITVQKEVADRLRAAPGGRDYGSLTVMIQSFYKIKRLFDIPPGCFNPRPDVMSSALILEPDRKLSEHINYPEFRDFLRGCFAQKRKKLVNSMTATLFVPRDKIIELLEEMGKNEDIRAERISIEEFMRLYESIKEYA